MRRGPKPAKPRGESKPPVARKSRQDDGARVRDLEKRLAEALEQQRASGEILRVISSSPTNLQPVLDAIATNAALVCDAYDAVVFLREGDRLRAAAHYGPITITLQHSTLSRGSVTEAAILDRQRVHVHDVLATEPPVFPLTAEAARTGGFRTVLSVPLLRENEAIGALAIRRREVQPFTTQQIALVETFADQAVIAIENVRLFNETKEALEQQTATGEILRVISSSPTDVKPVFAAAVASAARLCEALDAAIHLVDGDALRLVAHEGPIAPDPVLRLTEGTLAGRVIRERRAMHVADMQAETLEYPMSSEFARNRGFRTILSAPLLRGAEAIGTITIRRTEVRPFTDQQIALLKTFADQAVIAIENVRLFTELQGKNRALTQAHAQVTEALGQQTATSEILRVISSSPTDVQPVFDAIVRAAVRLCQAVQSNVQLFDGHRMHFVAAHNIGPAAMEMVQRIYPMPPNRNQTGSRAILDNAVVHVPDVLKDPEYLHELALQGGWRSVLSVPMVGKGRPIGAITVTRMEPGLFSDPEIALLQTFADQAVIAIENVRLFTELQEKNRAVTQAHAQVSEALEQQTATSEILRVIASSPTDIQPVLDTVAESAAHLCEAYDTSIFRLDGDRLRRDAHHGPIPAGVIGEFTVPLVRGSFAGRSVLDGRVVHIADGQTEANEFPEGSAFARRLGFRAILIVPLLREGVAIGAITLRRTEARLFTEREVALLQTFADQAVIAIENVRLFKELQTSNRELTAALDTQTATSDILRVISQSQTDVQPVFETIADSALRLLRAWSVAVFRVAGEFVHLAATRGGLPGSDEYLRKQSPWPLAADNPAGQCIVERAIIHVPDIEADSAPDYAWAEVRAWQDLAHTRGWRAIVQAPMLYEGRPIGVLSVTRNRAGAFTSAEIELLKTFADQAVIAIENVRLFTELQARTAELTRSVSELTALGEVGRTLSSTLDLETVLQTIVSRANELAGTAGCAIWEYDEPRAEFRLRSSDYPDEVDAAALQGVDRVTTIRKGVGVTTQVFERRQAVQIHDIGVEGAEENPIRRRLIEAGHHALLAVPLLSEDEVIGVLAVTRKTPGEFPPETVRLLQTFATQSALAIQNARLFVEIEEKSRQLEAASQHKSEFLANMSHELRTPLNAIIGFSEVLTDRMFGELNEKQDEYLKDIYASGTHLLSLINDILDLSKIEAGRMELEVTEFDLPTAIENALMLVRERAGRRSITLHTNIDSRVGQIQADERKVRQVVLNLLSNAIKFTSEGGRIDVGAVPKDGFVEVSVSDTGIGIAPEDQEKVFEEFRQVGTAAKKIEGTGLGLTLCRKFVELHRGKIWVKSQVGEGSTFTFTIPVRPGE